MENAIRTRLSQLEASEDIRILYACESGSRAWGFHSPDSDYDVRFIYVHKKDWYLSIESHKNFIELQKDEVFDISGFELRKFFQLFRSSNATVYEWLHSPIQYIRDEAFLTQVISHLHNYFSPRTALHHYIGLTRSSMENYLQGEWVPLKKYFYALRPVLAAQWIMKTGNCPPMEFSSLRDLLQEDELLNCIDRHLLLKASVGESYTIKPDSILHQFIGETLEQCAAFSKSLNKKDTDASLLDYLFRKTIDDYSRITR